VLFSVSSIIRVLKCISVFYVTSYTDNIYIYITEESGFIVAKRMAFMRPGGLSDNEDSDDDLLIEYDGTFNSQYFDRNEAVATARSQV